MTRHQIQDMWICQNCGNYARKGWAVCQPCFYAHQDEVSDQQLHAADARPPPPQSDLVVTHPVQTTFAAGPTGSDFVGASIGMGRGARSRKRRAQRRHNPYDASRGGGQGELYPAQSVPQPQYVGHRQPPPMASPYGSQAQWPAFPEQAAAQLAGLPSKPQPQQQQQFQQASQPVTAPQFAPSTPASVKVETPQQQIAESDADVDPTQHDPDGVFGDQDWQVLVEDASRAIEEIFSRDGSSILEAARVYAEDREVAGFLALVTDGPLSHELLAQIHGHLRFTLRLIRHGEKKQAKKVPKSIFDRM
jgi:hypothetical protein